MSPKKKRKRRQRDSTLNQNKDMCTDREDQKIKWRQNGLKKSTNSF